MVRPGDFVLSMCSSCLRDETLPDRDQELEGEDGLNRVADLFDRVGTFLCSKCWQERDDEARIERA
jgi:hypothetical protein